MSTIFFSLSLFLFLFLCPVLLICVLLGTLNISGGGIVHVCSYYQINDPDCPSSTVNLPDETATSTANTPSPQPTFDASPSLDSIPSPSYDPTPSSLKRQASTGCELGIRGDVIFTKGKIEGSSGSLVSEAHSRITVQGPSSCYFSLHFPFLCHFILSEYFVI